MERRSQYWQIIRAICIIAVIMIHCPNGTSLNQDSFQFWLYVFIRALVNFPVAIFIFMSGMFVNPEKI